MNALKRPKVIECGACGHADYHCPASGCNHAEAGLYCECKTFRQVTEIELGVLETISAGIDPYVPGMRPSIISQSMNRLVYKGCLTFTNRRYPNTSKGHYTCHLPGDITPSGHAVLLGCPPDVLESILSLVIEIAPPVSRLVKLSRDEREVLRDWAAREHLRASDNVVRRKPRPAILNSLLD